MFKPQLGVSLHMLSEQAGSDLVKQVAASGIATLEVNWRLGEPTAAAARSLLNRFRDEGALEVKTVHARFGGAYDFSALDPDVYRQSVQSVAAAIELAVELGAGIVVVHSGADNVTPEQRAERIAQSRRGLAELVPVARKAGRRVALELLPRTCLGRDVPELFTLLEGFEPDVLGVCLDTNHLMDRAATLPGVVRQLSDRLITLHLSDYDGVDEKHWLPGKGVLDWAAFMQVLKDIDYQGPFNYECHPPGETVEERIAQFEENFAWLAGLPGD